MTLGVRREMTRSAESETAGWTPLHRAGSLLDVASEVLQRRRGSSFACRPFNFGISPRHGLRGLLLRGRGSAIGTVRRRCGTGWLGPTAGPGARSRLVRGAPRRHRVRSSLIRPRVPRMSIYARRHNGTLTVRNNLPGTITIVRADGIGMSAGKLEPGAVASKEGAESVSHVSYMDASGERHLVAIREGH